MFTFAATAGADREQPAVEVGAVAEVLEDVTGFGVGRRADPVGAFAAHVGDREGGAIGQPDRHAVTADPALREAALGHDRRGVVRAARAERGQPQRTARRGQRRGWCGRSQPRREVGRRTREPAAQHRHDVAGRQLADVRYARCAVAVELAREARALGRVEQQARELLLDHGPLLFDHDQMVESARERADALGLERPRQRDLVQLEAEVARGRRVDAELVECLAHVEIGLARRDDAEPTPRAAAQEHAVESVRAHERLHRGQPLLVQPPLDQDG
jgi:hypothetical protein